MISNDQIEAAIRAALQRDPALSTDLVIKQAAETLICRPEWTARTDPRCRFPTYLSYAGPGGHVSYDRGFIRLIVSDARAEVARHGVTSPTITTGA